MPAIVTKNGNQVRVRYVERTITLAELIDGYVFITFSDGVRVNAGYVGGSTPTPLSNIILMWSAMQ